MKISHISVPIPTSTPATKPVVFGLGSSTEHAPLTGCLLVFKTSRVSPECVFRHYSCFVVRVSQTCVDGSSALVMWIG